MAQVTGFDYEFVEKPPEFFQTLCPICLLILREPYQVTCCGKSFCRACIQKIKSKTQPCPTCNKENFTDFPNLGLQQPLYQFRVFCLNKGDGCVWQGELGKLDQHLNLNPDKDKQEIGCAYTRVKCLHCSELYQRCLIKHHQTSECLLRPFSCEICKEFKSTYDDVTKNHAPSCNCRPVECTNCGSIMKHQKLKDHFCPLSMVKCEFSHAGCNVKMHRKDVPSHLSENMVTHLSLLLQKIPSLENENKTLKLELQESKYENKILQLELRDQANVVRSSLQKISLLESKTKKIDSQLLSCVPPIDITCEAKGNGPIDFTSRPFYSHTCGYKFEITVHRAGHFQYRSTPVLYSLIFTVLESEFIVTSPRTFWITAIILNQLDAKNNITHEFKLSYPSKKYVTFKFHLSAREYIKNNSLIIRIAKISMM